MTKLIKQLKEQPGFSESESMIANFLLENYRGLAALSTRQLAKLTYTSSAAIVRFAQKMGFEGYTEFKIQFVAEMMQYMSKPRDEAFSGKDTVRMIIDKVTGMEIHALQDTKSSLQPVIVVKALQLIKECVHIDFFATDDNLNLANLAGSSFILADKSYTVIQSIPQQYLMSAGNHKDHLSFIISRTGENRMLVDMAQAIKARKGKILLLTAEADSTLGHLADVVLPVTGVQRIEELGTRIFIIAAKYVLDILFASLVADCGLQDVCQRDKWLSVHFRY